MVTENTRKRLIVVGGDAAGMSAASQAKRRMGKDTLDVWVLERSPHISYAACGMPYMIGGVIEDPDKLLILKPETAREKRGIDVRLGHEAVAIDVGARTVTFRAGQGEAQQQSYDALVLATGALPRVPAVEGVNLDGVEVLRTFADGLKLKQRLSAGAVKDVVVVGAGLVGLEMAEAFRSRGCNVTLLKRTASALLGLEPAFDEQVEAALARNGCVLLKGSPLEAIVDNGRGGVAAVRAGGETRKADLVLLAAGVVPNTSLAAQAGIDLGAQKTIAVDEHLETSAPDVFAVGDCAAQTHRISGQSVFVSQALAANRMGKIAGANVAARLSEKGRFKTHPGTMATVLTKVFDLEVGMCGLTVAEARKAGFDVAFAWVKDRYRASYYPGTGPLYVGLVFEATGGRLLGGQLVGRQGAAKRLDVLVAALDAGMDLERLSRLDLGYCPPFAPAWDPLLVAATVARKKLEQ